MERERTIEKEREKDRERETATNKNWTNWPLDRRTELNWTELSRTELVGLFRHQGTVSLKALITPGLNCLSDPKNLTLDQLAPKCLTIDVIIEEMV